MNIKTLLDAPIPESYFSCHYKKYRDECPIRLINNTLGFKKNEQVLLEAVNCQIVMDWLFSEANDLEKILLNNIFNKVDVYNLSANYIESL